MAATSLSTQLAFDYGDLPAPEQKALERHAENVNKIQERQRRLTAENVIKLGEELSEAQKRLSNHGNGTFGKWCVERCGISSQTARRLIGAQESFGAERLQQFVANFDASAMYALSADTCPEEATKNALALAKKGEIITHKRAKEIIGEYTVDEGESESDDTDEAEEEAAPLDWQPAEFIVSMRAQVRSWLKRCPDDEIEFFAQTLRDLASQIERKANGTSKT